MRDAAWPLCPAARGRLAPMTTQCQPAPAAHPTIGMKPNLLLPGPRQTLARFLLPAVRFWLTAEGSKSVEAQLVHAGDRLTAGRDPELPACGVCLRPDRVRGDEQPLAYLPERQVRGQQRQEPRLGRRER